MQMHTSHPAGDTETGDADAQRAATSAAWRALDQAHRTLAAELEASLRTHHKLSRNAHAVLSQLARAPDRKLRMTDIAKQIDFSLSGLTGLVGRLEHKGLIERQSIFADRRVIYARLTDAGERYANEADLCHQETLDAILRDRLDRDELTRLTDLLRRITANGSA